MGAQAGKQISQCCKRNSRRLFPLRLNATTGQNVKTGASSNLDSVFASCAQNCFANTYFYYSCEYCSHFHSVIHSAGRPTLVLLKERFRFLQRARFPDLEPKENISGERSILHLFPSTITVLAAPLAEDDNDSITQR